MKAEQKLSQGRKRSKEWEEGGAKNKDGERRGCGKNSEWFICIFIMKPISLYALDE